MLSKKSVRYKFIVQLVLASTALIVIFSILLYSYIKISTFNAIYDSILQHGKFINDHYESNKNDIDLRSINSKLLIKYSEAKIVVDANKEHVVTYEALKDKNSHLIIVYYPLKNHRTHFIKLTKDIKPVLEFLKKTMFGITIVGLFMLIMIIFYALFLSRVLLVPIKTLSQKLTKMNEKFLSPIDTTSLYEEFVPLGESLNRIIDRMQNFTKYQKEFFIGIAHELKTPLAVMKTKNEVTLLKERDIAYYQEAIENNIKEIDEINQMASSILEIGRQEGAQLEEPVVFDVITLLKEKIEGFKLLAQNNDKTFKLNIHPPTYPTLAQPSLVIHIMQNFIQNAIKFSPQNSVVTIQTTPLSDGLLMEVLDEGEEIDESQDLFAPFKRYGQKGGTGLGLFLAKGASQALGGTISIKNRKDRQGVVASFFLPSSKPIGKIQ